MLRCATRQRSFQPATLGVSTARYSLIAVVPCSGRLPVDSPAAPTGFVAGHISAVPVRGVSDRIARATTRQHAAGEYAGCPARILCIGVTSLWRRKPALLSFLSGSLPHR